MSHGESSNPAPTVRPSYLNSDDQLAHNCETCLWHYDNVYHRDHCPRCRHAPKAVQDPRGGSALDYDGKPCMWTEIGPRPDNWWPRGGKP